MKIGRTLSLMGLVAMASLLMLSGCYFDINWNPNPDPEPEPEPLEAGIYFSLEWTDTDGVDPHLYVTYPAPPDGDTTDEAGTPPVMFEPYDYVMPIAGDEGFQPEDVDFGVPDEFLDDRGAVYYNDLRSDLFARSGAAVEFVDSSSNSELTIVRAFPFESSALGMNTVADGSSDDLTGLPSGEYAWVGIMQVYAYASGGQLAYEGSSDDVAAVLYVFEADGAGTETILASYEVPSNTDVKGASLLRINCLYEQTGASTYAEVYQFLPDVRVINSTTQIRSVVPAEDAAEPEIVTIRRSAN